MHIRTERPEDIPGIRHVNETAFDTAGEADLVDALRQQAHPIVSLVAVDEEAVVGHILFSPVTLLPHVDRQFMGLAPMAVLPGRQRQGIGSALVRAGLDACRERGFDAVVVLGHADYYPRFGFVPASTFGVRSEYDVQDDVFLAIELSPGALRERAGTIRYHVAFAAV
ncbi:MAG: N-acetyltransferase [Acidobacteria bacterium]|nr:N-acetyltransferase [Acidobacteriota bacterium]